jgi:exosortase
LVGKTSIHTYALNAPLSSRQIGLLIGGLIVVVLGAYWPMVAALWNYWLQPYVGGQGVLVAALSLWLMYRQRDRLSAAPARPVPWAILLVALCSVATLLLWRAGIQTLYFMMLPLLIFAAIFAAFGPRIAGILLVPVSYLYFAMPTWQFLSPYLQAVTVRVTGELALLLGLPATVHGTLISFPNGAIFEVTPLCSGVGFLVQGLAVATLLGELEQACVARRLRLLGSMIIVALIANWVRAVIIVQVGYATGMRHVLVSGNHLLFGWLLFVCVLLVFVWLATRGPLPPQRETPGAVGAQAPSLSGFLTAVAALTVAPVLIYLVAPSRNESVTWAGVQWPVGRADWRGPLDNLNSGWRPVFIGAHAESYALYQDPSGESVEVLAVGYALQVPGRKLVSENNSLLGMGLTQLTGLVVGGDGQSYYEMTVADREGRHSVIWSVYDIGGRAFATPLPSQLWYGVSSLTAQPYSVLFAFRAQCVPSCSAARGRLAGFARQLGPELIAIPASTPRPVGRESAV